MRVAIISTAWKKVPPNGYGGIENVVANILTGSRELGLDIDFNLFTVGQSYKTLQIQNLNSRVKPSWFFQDECYPEIGNETTKVWIEAIHAMCAWDMVLNEKPDIIHDHSGIGFTMIARFIKERPPILVTLHGSLDIPLIQDFYRLLAKTPGIYFNSISNAQRRALPELPYVGTVYNGVKLDELPFSQDKENYLLILGRITPVKGQKEAIEAAKSLNIPLVIAGSVENNSEAEKYWQNHVMPQIEADLSKENSKIWQLRSLFKTANSPGVIYFGEADSEDKKLLYAKARAFMMPIYWEEPFGLVITEAMACGTPVVAFKRGAAPEIVEDGLTGFLVDNTKEMVDALRQVDVISPYECRKRVEEKFSHKKMAESYSKFYGDILRQNSVCAKTQSTSSLY